MGGLLGKAPTEPLPSAPPLKILEQEAEGTYTIIIIPYLPTLQLLPYSGKINKEGVTFGGDDGHPSPTEQYPATYGSCPVTPSFHGPVISSTTPSHNPATRHIRNNNKTIKLYPGNSKKREAAELKRLKREVGALHRRELERDRRRDQLKREERDRRRITDSIREELKERRVSDRRSRIDDHRRRGY